MERISIMVLTALVLIMYFAYGIQQGEINSNAWVDLVMVFSMALASGLGMPAFIEFTKEKYEERKKGRT